MADGLQFTVFELCDRDEAIVVIIKSGFVAIRQDRQQIIKTLIKPLCHRVGIDVMTTFLDAVGNAQQAFFLGV